jgi:uncharacterized membrane protein YdbT with pleckstrin-like domain
MEEKVVWRGSSSQLVNFKVYAICIVLVAFVVGVFSAASKNGIILLAVLIPLAIAFWNWLENKCRVFEVTTERIRLSQGIFTKRTDELELYRVKDSTLVEPFVYRMFGLGNIVLTTVDTTTPGLTLDAIRDAGPLREELRKNIEVCRDRKRVRMAEIDEPMH